MNKWKVSLRLGDGKPFVWTKDYPGKGHGSIDDMLSGRYYWSVEIDPGDEMLDYALWASGYLPTLKEAKDRVDYEFSLIAED